MKISRKFLNEINSTALIAIVIGIIATLNFFSYNISYRFDLTQNQDYTLSAASKKTAANLKDVVSIKAYFSSGLPAQYLNLRQEVGDLLDEYVNYSGGKIKVEFVDPKDDQATAQELRAAGIPQLQFNTLEKDKYQVVNGYLGLVIKYGEKSQAIPVIQGTSDFEYLLTSAIKKVTNDEAANIGFWQGNGAADAVKDTGAAYKKLGEIYNVSSVNYAAEKSIPEYLDTLIIVGPKEKFGASELKALDGFLARGGSLVILADGVAVGQGLEAKKNDLGFNTIFEAYGVKFNNNLVLDVNNGLASFSQGFVTFTTSYPYWPKVVKSGFDQNNLAVARLESLVLPWASSFDVDQNKTKGLAVSFLARTTDRALAVADNFQLSPQASGSAAGVRGRFNLAVAISGKFSSALNSPDAKDGHLVLVGDGDFLSDSFLMNYPDNLVFFQNVVDSLSLGDDLIAIRSKGVTERPLMEIGDSVKNAVRYGNIFGLTAIVVLFGLARYYMRRGGGREDEF
ncbi:MAG: GldG family protein [bacterium]|nr:GldG family protein [bacterium]